MYELGRPSMTDNVFLGERVKMIACHPTNPSLRSASQEDISWLRAVETHPSNRLLIGSFSIEAHLRNLADDDYQYFLLEQDKTSVAFAILRGLRTTGGIVELKRIVASESGKGYGRRLLEGAIAHLFESGYRKVWLSVFTDNLRAIQVYESLGFVREGLLNEHYVDADGTGRDLYVYGLVNPARSRSAE